MSNESDNNKRIAKNTLLLYFRMLFMMVVSLYTSRVILNALGVEDFGIYNVVGGVVAMFSVISGSLSAAISRFITYELGKGDQSKLNKIFSASVTIQLLLALIIVILIESVGVWFMNVKMAIPTERMLAANWVLQFSIITFVINLISVPYNAAIIAHEEMSAFAYISIIEAIGKLAIAFLIMWAPIDKLIFYSFLMCLVAIFVRFTYGHYCKKHFKECTYHFFWDKEILYKMFGFAGWNFLGAGSLLLMTQGVNILINLFFGVGLNAARGIANQVDSAVQQFVNSFSTAINPQITKSYAVKDYNYMHNLVCSGSKYSFFLSWFFTLPLLLEGSMVLELWLKNVPNNAIIFMKLALCISLLSVVSNTLVTSMLATGNIKKYQIIVGGFGMTIFPLVYIAYKLGMPAYSAYLIHFSIFVIQLIVRLQLLKHMIMLPIKDFFKKAILKDLKVIFLSSIFPCLIVYYMPPSFFRLFIVLTVSILSILISIYFAGLTKQEKIYIRFHLLSKIKTR